MAQIFNEAAALRSLGYRDAKDREECVARRRQNHEWWKAKGYHLLPFGAYLLMDCSLFTELVYRGMTRAGKAPR